MKSHGHSNRPPILPFTSKTTPRVGNLVPTSTSAQGKKEGEFLAHKQNSRTERRLGSRDRSGLAIIELVWKHAKLAHLCSGRGGRRQALFNLSPSDSPLDTCCAEYFNFTRPLLPVTIKLLTYVARPVSCQCDLDIFYRSSIVSQVTLWTAPSLIGHKFAVLRLNGMSLQ